MLFKIFLQNFTFYLFAGGYILTFVVAVILKFPIFNSFWIAFIGGISLCGIWGFCIKLLTILFSKNELAKLFGLSMSEGIADAFNEEDDEDELTLTDLYNPDEDEYDNESSHITNEMTLSDIVTPRDINDIQAPETNTSGKFDMNGNFDLTVDGKTLKASPQDGAQAIKKILHTPENE